jgi:uncharacterized protein YndB with AHSA1/START domain
MANVDKTTGRRSVELEFDLPGTPEQVWQAIATGPGITCWFVPSEVEEHKGGKVAFHLGPGMESSGTVTVWDPTRRIAYEEAGWSGKAPPLATEFTIEARGGGTCRVRLVHSLFTSEASWDEELDGMQSGWGPFFEVLRIYLRHFAGQRCTLVGLSGSHSGTHVDAWKELLNVLDLPNPKVGEQRTLTGRGGSPSLAGVVERIEVSPRHNEVILRFDRPTTGVALFSTFSWGDRTNVAISIYFYGEGSARVAAREEPAWKAWIAQQFPQAKDLSA